MNDKNDQILKINYIASEAYSFDVTRFTHRLGHHSLYYTDCMVHPHLSIGWFCDTLEDEEASLIRREELMSTSPLGLSVQAIDILKKISDCDVIHTNGLYAHWAVLSGRPFIYQVFGGDVTRWPFLDDTEVDRLRAHFIREILEKATFIWGGYHQKDTHNALEQLGISPDKVKPLCQPIDSNSFCPLPEDEWIGLRRAHDSLGKFVILLGSQLKMTPTKGLNYSKGSHLFAQAVHEFIAQTGGDKVVFWVIDKGPQRLEFRDMVKDMGLEQHIRWIKPRPKSSLVTLINAADVVLDQLWPTCGAHGTFTLEAMSCGKPVFLYLDRDFRENIAREPELPNVQVSNVEEIKNRLVELFQDPEKRKEIGARSRECMLTHYHYPVACRQILDMYRSAVALPRDPGHHR